MNFIAGTSSDGRHVDEICGQRNYTKMSESNVLSVVFSSSEVIEYRGFVFQYFARKSSVLFCGAIIIITRKHSVRIRTDRFGP